MALAVADTAILVLVQQRVILGSIISPRVTLTLTLTLLVHEERFERVFN